jgi:hypothetical protein
MSPFPIFGGRRRGADSVVGGVVLTVGGVLLIGIAIAFWWCCRQSEARVLGRVVR